MEIVKKNLVSVISGVVALLAVVFAFFPTGSFFSSLEEKMKASATDYQSIKSIKGQPFKLPKTDPDQAEDNFLSGFPNKEAIAAGKKAAAEVRAQREAMAAKAAAMNAMSPLVPGLFPAASDSKPLFQFKQRYHQRMMEMKTELNATMPPNQMEIDRETRAIWDKDYKPRLKGDNQNLEELRNEFAMREIPKIAERLKQEKASKYSLYMNDPALVSNGGPGGAMMPSGGGLDYYAGIPAMDRPELPLAADVWAAQVSLWIQDEIVKAIVASNKGQSVTQAPVKRLVSVDIPKEYITKTGPVPFGGGGVTAFGGAGLPPAAAAAGFGAAASTGADAAGDDPNGPLPKVYTYGFTGRVCNSLYDVMHFTLKVHVDAREVENFMFNLSDKKFVTILEARMSSVDHEQAEQCGYVYGKAPVVQLTLKCEALFLRQWTVGEFDTETQKWKKQGLMPMEIRQLLGIQDPSAAATGGVAGVN